MKPISEMTDPELNEALAIEGMEFSYFDCIYYGANGLEIELGSWNPTADLNQCRMLENALLDFQRNIDVLDFYENKLKEVVKEYYCGSFAVINATPRQKCEALLATFREAHKKA